MQKLSLCLWFDNQAEEAAKFYVAIFKNGKIGKIARYTKEGFEIHGRPAGSVMTVSFELNGQKYMALNGGPLFQFNEAISIVITCETQQEIDYYWEKLSEGGSQGSCGWLKDKYGVSWQVVPSLMENLFADANSEKSQKIMKALLQMKKLDIQALKKA